MWNEWRMKQLVASIYFHTGKTIYAANESNKLSNITPDKLTSAPTLKSKPDPTLYVAQSTASKPDKGTPTKIEALKNKKRKIKKLTASQSKLKSVVTTSVKTTTGKVYPLFQPG